MSTSNSGWGRSLYVQAHWLMRDSYHLARQSNICRGTVELIAIPAGLDTRALGASNDPEYTKALFAFWSSQMVLEKPKDVACLKDTPTSDGFVTVCPRCHNKGCEPRL